jgi:hypothetical protein
LKLKAIPFITGVARSLSRSFQTYSYVEDISNKHSSMHLEGDTNITLNLLQNIFFMKILYDEA